jgi:hypothetical protein
MINVGYFARRVAPAPGPATGSSPTGCTRRFALEQPEPGDYYVVEVLEGAGARIDPS